MQFFFILKKLYKFVNVTVNIYTLCTTKKSRNCQLVNVLSGISIKTIFTCALIYFKSQYFLFVFTLSWLLIGPFIIRAFARHKK